MTCALIRPFRERDLRQCRGDSALSRAAIDLLARRFPRVPIRRVMSMHFHSDRAAGLRAVANMFAWLPHPHVLFQGDLFHVDADGTQPPIRMGVMREFVRFLDARGIAPALMWGMHGNVPATAALLAAVRTGSRR